MKSSDSRHVIIIGGNHHNTLGVIRALGYKGLKSKIHLILEGDSKSFVSKSKYLNKSEIYYIKNEFEIPELLVSITSCLQDKPVVIACGDHYISALDDKYDELKKYCILPNAKATQGRINFYLDKENQDKVAKSNGLSIPEFDIVNTKTLTEYDILPCILKPINSVNGSKSDIAVCRTHEGIIQYIKEHPDIDKIRVEKFIDKVFEFQLIGCSLYQDIIIPGYTNIIRQPQNTNTGYLIYRPISDGFILPELLQSVKAFIQEIGYYGLFSVEFLRDKQGNDFFLEINMRNDGNAYCVTTAGVNLPYIWYKYCDKGHQQIHEPRTFKHEIYWMPEADFRNAKKVGIFKWVREWFLADSHGIACCKDPYPLVSRFISKLVHL